MPNTVASVAIPSGCTTRRVAGGVCAVPSVDAMPTRHLLAPVLGVRLRERAEVSSCFDHQTFLQCFLLHHLDVAHHAHSTQLRVPIGMGAHPWVFLVTVAVCCCSTWTGNGQRATVSFSLHGLYSERPTTSGRSIALGSWRAHPGPGAARHHQTLGAVMHTARDAYFTQALPTA